MMSSTRNFTRAALAAVSLGAALLSGSACAATQNVKHATVAPVAVIETPRDGATFTPGDTLVLIAAEAGAGSLRYDWTVEVLDRAKTVATFRAGGAEARVLPRAESMGEGTTLRVQLAVSDARGRRSTASARVYAGPPVEAAGSIGAGDVLQIAIYAGGEKQEEFTGEVTSAGTVATPLLGEVKAAGSTTSELARRMQKMLGDKYFVNPQVLVTLKGQPDVRRKVFVLGEVAKPGAYPLEEGLTVMQACTLAGGFTNFASLGGVRVTRTAGGARQTFTVDLMKVRNGKKEDVLLRAGDQIDVPHRRF